MKKLALFLFFQIAYCAFLSAQVPGKMNYQAVIRNNNGDLIVNQSVKVRVSIIDEATDGNELYTELHSVTTSSYGLVNFMIGNGTVESGNFVEINWGEKKKFLGISVDVGTEYVAMGTVQLLAVPYALYANDVANKDDADANPTNEIQELEIIGDTLKISSGNQVVFPYDSSYWVANGDKLFYNTGNVGIGSSTPVSKLEVKSTAISGALFQVINSNNDTVFAVYSDGVKVFTDSEAKGKVGGFAVSGRNPSKGIVNYFNVSGDNTPTVINPSESRVVWFPRKEAFWAGKVLIEHPDSVSLNSLAIGYEAIAKGNNSQSLGYQTRARGNFSTAIGYRTQANGVGCFAVGGEERGVDGTATGVNTKAEGIASFALGLGANASGIANTAIGLRSSATGNFASTAFGVFAQATATRATAVGFGSVASAEQSLAIGVSDTAYAYNSMAMGVGSKATGIAAIALGAFVEANNTGTLVVGQLNNPFGTSDYWNTSDPLFVIGNGIFGIPGVLSTAIRSNALTILKNGNMGVGIDTPERKVHIKDVMRLEPRVVAPSNPSEGDIYYDSTLHKLMVFDGTIWQACF